MAVEALCFVFQDADGILSFSLNEHEGAPNNPRFLFDGDKRLLLLRRPGQLISLDSIAEEFLPLLRRSEKVPFVFSLFLTLPSISGFSAFRHTSNSCSFVEDDLKSLKRYVKRASVKENVHTNTVWARLKKKYGFKRYAEIDCILLRRILSELPEIEDPPQEL